MNTAYQAINNITYSNLFDFIHIKNEKDLIQFEFNLTEKPIGNESIFYFNNYSLNFKNKDKKVICKAPLIIFPRYKKLYLYSYLSCFNLIEVGWFQLVDDYVIDTYDLIYYNFDEINKIYDPSERITEYNEKMINYYYWFSCFSYCDDDIIDKNKCCSDNILKTWEIVFHKQYKYEKKFLDLILDIVEDLEIVSPPKKDFIDSISKAIKQFFGYAYYSLKNIFNEILGKTFETYHNTFMYQYNFVILKSDEYKKIVVSFPGLTTYYQVLQILEMIPLIFKGFKDGEATLDVFGSFKMIDLPINSINEYFSVSKIFLDIFSTIEKDLFN